MDLDLVMARVGMDLEGGGSSGDEGVEVGEDAGDGQAGDGGEDCDFDEEAWHFGLRPWCG